MKKYEIIVDGMTCSHCEKTIKETLETINGIKNIKVSFKTKSAVFFTDDFKEEEIKNKISEAGYKYKGEKQTIPNSRFKEISPYLIGILLLYLIVGQIIGFDFLNFVPKAEEKVSYLILFSIGLLTSVHCISMCGAINLSATNNTKSIKGPLYYNLGRIISYTTIGALIGALGSVVSINNEIKGAIILFAAIMMLLMGLSMIGMLPKFMYKFLYRHTLVINKTNNKFPFTIGILNGFMPCGPLQAMQLYALSTASFIDGGLSMFFFALGTTPLMFSFGFLFTKLKKKYNVTIQKVSTALIILLSFIMISRGLSFYGIDLKETFFKTDYSKYEIAEIKGDIQYVTIDLEPRGYKPIVVQKGIKVIFNIKGDEYAVIYGCTNAIIIPKLKIEKKLYEGDNIIEFTPTKTGKINYSCWMGMVKSHILVVDDLSDIKI